MLAARGSRASNRQRKLLTHKFMNVLRAATEQNAAVAT